MLRKTLVFGCCVLLLAAESAYFLRRAMADVVRIRGERAFLRNEHPVAFRRYMRALTLGGDREMLEIDIIEVLAFGLDQDSVGIDVDAALPPREALPMAYDLLSRRIRQRPYVAYYWSLAADLYMYRSVQRRRETPLNLDTLSEDPLENLLPEQWLAVAALETAGRLEPNNYIYHNLLAEMFLDVGSPERAALACRRAVAAYPVHWEHRYLTQAGLQPQVLEAALLGFEEARQRPSMIPAGVIESEAGRLLMVHGQTERALPYFRRAAVLAPDLYEAQYPLGVIAYQSGDHGEALERLREASRILPDSGAPHYYMGLSYLRLEMLPAAIQEFRTARAKEPQDLKLFYALGEALERAGEIQEAERQYLAAANLNATQTEGWSALLLFYLRHRDLRKAAGVCGRLRTLQPQDPPYQEQCASLVPSLS
jgi:tetratricopeptide (TPR) repeat protein